MMAEIIICMVIVAIGAMPMIILGIVQYRRNRRVLEWQRAAKERADHGCKSI